jgi:hypothetical protein
MITTAWTATRTARALPAARSGAALTCGLDASAKHRNGIKPMFAVGVPAYVADQESHPPRETCVG